MTIVFGSLGAMVPLSSRLRFVLVALAGWVNQQQRDVIDYLQEENRALREQLGPGRLRFTHDQRRRLAAKAKARPTFETRRPSNGGLCGAREGERPWTFEIARSRAPTAFVGCPALRGSRGSIRSSVRTSGGCRAGGGGPPRTVERGPDSPHARDSDSRLRVCDRSSCGRGRTYSRRLASSALWTAVFADGDRPCVTPSRPNALLR
jgi:hypothetical protein